MIRIIDIKIENADKAIFTSVLIIEYFDNSECGKNKKKKNIPVERKKHKMAIIRQNLLGLDFANFLTFL